MKNLILIFSVTIQIALHAQKAQFPVDNESKKILFSGVVTTTDSISIQYSKAKEIIATRTNSSAKIILDDINAKIFFKDRFKVCVVDEDILSSCSISETVEFTVKIYFKDFKYKYELTDINFVRITTAAYLGFTINETNPTVSIRTKFYPLEDFYPLKSDQNCKKKYGEMLDIIYKDINEYIISLNADLKKDVKKEDNW